jgi:hypothetical protein
MEKVGQLCSGHGHCGLRQQGLIPCGAGVIESREVLWPGIAAICNELHPASAGRRQIAFRRPWALHCGNRLAVGVEKTDFLEGDVKQLTEISGL